MRLLPKTYRLMTLVLLLSQAFVLNAQVKVNEIFATNGSKELDTYDYNYCGRVELYNTGTGTLNIGGYFLSNDRADRFKWAIPSNTSIGSHAFKTIWCDELHTGLHTNFDLDADTGIVILSNASGLVIDSIAYSRQQPDISYGRQPDGVNNWYFFAQTTPAASNNSVTAYTGISGEPIFSVPGGFYSSGFNLTINAPTGGNIRFTTDGSIPTESSALLVGSQSINQTQVIRARLYENGKAPGPVVTHSYFVNEHHTGIPIVSLSMNPIFLWDNMQGIYVEGSNGIPGNCIDYNVNFNQDWERSMNFEFFNPDGEQAISQAGGTKIAGGCSRGYPCKSMSFYARYKYGPNKYRYRFFNDKPYDDYKRLLLRNSGNDWGWSTTMFRDAMMQTLVKNTMDVDYQEYQPVAAYLNGAYWGVMELREKVDEHYVETNYGIESEMVDLIEVQTTTNGDGSSYWNMIAFMENNSLGNQSNYEWVKTQMDVDEYMNYQIAQIYFANTDWPGNNIKYWRDHSPGGKWRWVIYDTDFGFGLATDVSHNTLSFALDSLQSGWPNPEWSTFLFRKLLVNDKFKQNFIQKFLLHINSTFQPERVIGIIDSLQSILAPEMPYHFERWGGNMNDWENNVNNMRWFALNRPQYVIQHISEVFGLSGYGRLTVIKNQGGRVYINDGSLPTDTFNGVFVADYPIRMRADAKPGYRFVKWVRTTIETETEEFFPQGGTWKYFDSGYLPAADWNQNAYNDDAWVTGNAQLGYGEGDEATIIGYGPDANNKYVTSYFRSDFQISNVGQYESLVLNLLRDDGAVVYINGTEVIRSNMPDGVINYNTWAGDNTGTENVFITYEIPSTYLIEGTNCIAVEVHQLNGTSTDVSFDLQLQGIKNITNSTDEIFETEFLQTVDADITINAYFESSGGVTNLYINEFMADNSSIIADAYGEYDDWIELYNDGSEPVNVSGLFISDSIDDPTKYRIPLTDPDRTEIPPGGFLLLWADKQEEQGVLHIGIKLGKSGEQIAICQIVGTDTIIIDSLVFGPQDNDISFGLYPDGSEEGVFFTSPTPGYSNILSTVVDHGRDTYNLFPNPAKDFVILYSEQDEDFKVELFDLFGRSSKESLLCGKGENRIDLSGMPPGIYLVKITTGKREQVFKLNVIR